MLILTRKLGETVRIGSDISVRVLGVRAGQVSLGFTAPRALRILREEILQAIEEENQRASRPDAEGLAEAEAMWRELGRGSEDQS
jgi:carbon storage regulator